ncbi:MAG: hypothetical protein ACI82G_001873, partial [Bradymonadia bacterium]
YGDNEITGYHIVCTTIGQREFRRDGALRPGPSD